MSSKNLKTLFTYLFLPLFLFFLFEEKITQYISIYIANPFLSSIIFNNWIYDFAFILFLAYPLFFIFKKINNGAVIPLKTLLISLVFLTIYCYYRYLNDNFSFEPFNFSNLIRPLDLFPISILSILAFTLLKKTSKFLKLKSSKNTEELKTEKTNHPMFKVDEPIIISTENDIFKRLKFVKELTNNFKYLNETNSAFNVGIVAPWGFGKTSFMKTLKKHIEEEPDFITIELNLWKCNSPNQIIEMLFKLLRENLKPFSFRIDNQMEEYSKDLIKGFTKNRFSDLIDRVFPSASLEKQFIKIRNEIKSIKKKVLILIDDIDRLDKNEIYEVIRLIRNTASFPNFYFVVAYDRNYILNGIEEINTYQIPAFLEKIFQYEFVLPPIPNEVLQQEVQLMIKSVLSEKYKNEYIEFIQKKKHDEVTSYGQVDLTKKYIFNIRDVIRFSNSFSMSHSFLKGEVYFPDFYNIELIKFKHPEIISKFYRSSNRFLSTFDEEYKEYDTFFLRSKNDDLPNFEKFLLGQKLIYKIDENEIDTIIVSLNSIFRKKNTANYHSINKGTKSHLSIIHPLMYDRYFQMELMAGNLSEEQLSTARILPCSDFLKKIEEFCENKDLIIQLRERLFEIDDFKDKNDFEKILKAIFLICNSFPFAGKNYIGFYGHYQTIGNLIGNKKIVKQFYDNKNEKYKLFWNELLNIKTKEYNGVHELVYNFNNAAFYEISEMYSIKEIKQMLLNYLKFAIKENSKFTPDLWWHYFHCTYRKESKGDIENSIRVSYPINVEANSLLKSFIFTKDLDGFIRRIAIQKSHHSDDYGVSNLIDQIFETKQNFVDEVENYKGKSLYKDEFIKFYTAWSKLKDEKEKAQFSNNYFKVIPVEKGFSGE